MLQKFAYAPCIILRRVSEKGCALASLLLRSASEKEMKLRESKKAMQAFEVLPSVLCTLPSLLRAVVSAN